MKVASFLLVVSSLLACGCASSGGTASPRERLVVVRPCAVTCSGSIGIDYAGEGAEPPAAAPAGGETSFHATVGVARVSHGRANALLDTAPLMADAAVVTTDSAERALAGTEGLIPGRPCTAADLGAGVVTDLKEFSFIDRFDLTETDSAAILDPQIGVYQTGHRLLLRPARNEADGSWTVEVTLLSVDAARPALAKVAKVLGSDSDVLVQVPLLAKVETRTTATLAQGESLVVVSPELLRGDSVVVAVVTPER